MCVKLDDILFGNRVLRRIFGPNRAGSNRRRENSVIRSSVICIHSPNIIRINQIKENEMGGVCYMHGSDENCI
jgi:hypothetical protein